MLVLQEGHSVVKQDRLFNKMAEARKSIVATGKSTGVVVCPMCGDRLAFRVMDNGHIHASCKTKDCLTWME